MKYIKNLSDVSQHDVALVGGKTASLGEMLQHLAPQGIQIPDGFAITADAYRHFISAAGLTEPISNLIARIHDYNDVTTVEKIAAEIRHYIEASELPEELVQEITHAYQTFCRENKKKNISVAVRSSATAEDLPGASFAGQQETFLDVRGVADLLIACKKCFASLFTARAIVYRYEQQFDQLSVALAMCVQQMVRSDRGASGVAFTIDTESGFSEVVSISASYGLGESIVQGLVNPDEYRVYKKRLNGHYYPILQKKLGNKLVKTRLRLSGPSGSASSDGQAVQPTTEVIPVPKKLQQQFVLNNAQIELLADWCIRIEQHYQRPMDIEWAYDGVAQQMYIVQARPETIYGTRKQIALVQYTLKPTEKVVTITQGQSIGHSIVSGRVHIMRSKDDLGSFTKGDILVTQMTDPDWVPLMKQAAGIITDLGGRTCHAAIVSRELGIPAVVGTNNATAVLHDGQEVTIDTSTGSVGFVYQGSVPFEKETINTEQLATPPCQVMMNLADPDGACAASLLPVAGVGLARVEFIINTAIGIHPMAAIDLEKVVNKKIKKEIEERACAYENVRAFFVETLAQGISMIVGALYPRPVIVRLSDFKSNEYRDLLGGSYFEPHEENPMLGWRGASRYTTPSYEPAFALECAALKQVLDAGFTNMKIMVPFVRTVAEAERTVATLRQHGIERGVNGLQLYMMVEIPSNVVLLEHFAQHFDGFSIGSNDLTQLTLGVDRDSGLLTHLFDERDEAVKLMLAAALKKAKSVGKPIGICGQAPSDYPEIAQFLIERGIDSISLNKDAVLPFLMRYSAHQN